MMDWHLSKKNMQYMVMHSAPKLCNIHTARLDTIFLIFFLSDNFSTMLFKWLSSYIFCRVPTFKLKTNMLKYFSYKYFSNLSSIDTHFCTKLMRKTNKNFIHAILWGRIFHMFTKLYIPSMCYKH